MKTSVYACYNKCASDRDKSSSGGVYILLAREILKKNGVVFAVCYDENMETYHRMLETEEELMLSLGSKYIPSKLYETFNQIKDNLDRDRQVLFVGTPCQCSGLKFYLQKDYDNLLCVDFICHGVPSRKAWRSYLALLNKNGVVNSINMRDKTSGWSKFQYSWRINYKNGKTLTVLQDKISFMKGFTSDYYLRPSCYECKFKRIERCTDITMGDFWGVWDIQPDMDDNHGTSLVLIHSAKGKEIFDLLDSKMVKREMSLSHVLKYNPSILYSAKKTTKREKFFEYLSEGKEFDNIIRKLSRGRLKEKIVNRLRALRNNRNKGGVN